MQTAMLDDIVTDADFIRLDHIDPEIRETWVEYKLSRDSEKQRELADFYLPWIIRSPITDYFKKNRIMFKNVAEKPEDLAGEVYEQVLRSIELFDLSQGLPFQKYVGRAVDWALSKASKKDRLSVIDKNVVSGDEPIYEDGTSRFDITSGSVGANPFSIIGLDEVLSSPVFDNLSERERLAFEKFYVEGLTQRQIGAEVYPRELGVQTVRQGVNNDLAGIREKLLDYFGKGPTTDAIEEMRDTHGEGVADIVFQMRKALGFGTKEARLIASLIVNSKNVTDFQYEVLLRNSNEAREQFRRLQQRGKGHIFYFDLNSLKFRRNLADSESVYLANEAKYSKMGRTEFLKTDPSLARKMQEQGVLDRYFEPRVRYGNDLMKYYNDHHDGKTRTELPRGLYEQMRSQGLLDQIPIKRGDPSKDILEYETHYAELTRGQLKKQNRPLYARMRRKGLLESVPK